MKAPVAQAIRNGWISPPSEPKPAMKVVDLSHLVKTPVETAFEIYFRQRRQRPVSAGRGPGVDYSRVDWSKTNQQIAAELGCVSHAVSQKRASILAKLHANRRNV